MTSSTLQEQQNYQASNDFNSFNAIKTIKHDYVSVHIKEKSLFKSPHQYPQII